MNELLSEAQRMPAASIAAASVTVRTPEHLVPLRERVRRIQGARLRQLHEQINERFGTTGATGATDDYVFYVASEMALMEWVEREELTSRDRRSLREL